MEAFNRGRFDNGGDNLYVNADGVIETIHRFDINNDGFVDLVFPNSHGYIERGPTWIYTQAEGDGAEWPRQELANDSSWMSRVADVDGDGFPDLIIVNGENGVTSELDSYVYWGGPGGLTGERTELPTAGAYDVAYTDLTGNGLLDLLLPSAWVDHHNAGKPRLVRVYEQREPRRFTESSEKYGIFGIAATSIACEDLDGDGKPELVLANYRSEFEYETDSFLYRGTENGFNTASPLILPASHVTQVILGDLNGDGAKEIVFTGGNRVDVYWNENGTFRPENRTILTAEGNSTMFCIGSLHVEIADIDGDGKNELLIATRSGIEIRKQDDLQSVMWHLPLEYSSWVEAVDLTGDGTLDLIAGRYHDGKMYESHSAVFWNGPDGYSSDRVTWLPTTGAVGCTAGDLDGDGRPEIIFNNTMRGWCQFNPDFPIYVYLGNDTHEYGADRRLELPTGGSTNTYALSDLNHNGFPDLVFPSPEGLRIFPGGPSGPAPDRYTILPDRGHPVHYVLTADLDKDGWLDLIAISYTYDAKPETMANSSVIYYGSPDGFSVDRSEVLPTFTTSARLIDVDNDGWIDVMFWDKRGYISFYYGGPKGYSPDRMGRIDLEVDDIGHVSSINPADLNGDGYLDLIVTVMGHYSRKQSGFFILYGGPEGYSAESSEFHPTDASGILISAADLNRDGNLDLLVPQYSTEATRVLPAYIYCGDGRSFDFANPLEIPCDASCAFQAIDITGNGYPDLLTICHRNDLGHQVDSLLFWNGPEGISPDRVTRLPGLGPHLSSPRDFGNSYTREPWENYVSPPYEMRDSMPERMDWKAEIPDKTNLRFQLRWAAAEAGLDAARWQGPGGVDSWYDQPGQGVRGVPVSAGWLQYRAAFVSLDGCRSPRLEEVRIEFR